jgi:predicted PurR-regulated permease PerM
VRYHARAVFFEAAFAQIVGGYLRGQLLVAIIIGTGVATLTMLTGVRYSLLLGFLAGVLELVPMLGPFLAAAPSLAVAFSQSTAQALLVLAGFFVIQQVEANVLAPRITGRAVGLPAAAALIAMLVGVSLGGLLGALFAIPAAGFGNAVLRAWYRQEVAGGYEPVETPAPPDVDIHAAELPTVGQSVADAAARQSVHGPRGRADRHSAKPEGG